jgi:hypothetical protein
VGEKSSARAALDARRPMLGDSRCRCDERPPLDGIETIGVEAGGGADDAAAAPTGFPQSMQNDESAVFERPQNAQAIKLGLQGVPR